MKQNKVAACVVLYHPSLEVLQNITSYYKCVDYLIAIDNSENKNQKFEKAFYDLFPEASYQSQYKNLGIAAALNIAAKGALQMNHEWLLTMDQDSCFKEGDVTKMIADIDEVERKFEGTAIITPYHLVNEKIILEVKEKYSERKIAMTSGNLLYLEAFKKAGGFDEKLFIDFVDYEYCLRLHQNNYKIIQHNKIWLQHSLGNLSVKKFLLFKIFVTNHNHVRKYYQARNSLHVGFKYASREKKFFLNVLLMNILLEPILIVLYEKNKLIKLKWFGKGVIDFCKGKFGEK